ncbi:MAG TPA: hypothetical protein VHW04_19410 [Solirubrobacteraceae bacterium]|nr:hypothetical protein [Solirubrobacteraceae bacterium]
MRRRKLVSLIVAAVVVFLVVSALLARGLSIGGAEDSAITDLVKAEARGDAGGVARLVDGCRGSATCRARATANSRALKRSGTVSIIQIQPSAGFSLTSTLGTARVAWLVGSSLPRVQCVRVHRVGNLLQGFTVKLLQVSVRIESDHACPAHF